MEINYRLKVILPSDFQYKLLSFSDTSNFNGFEARLKTNVFTGAGAEEWLKQFEQRSSTNFRVRKTCPREGSKVIFKKSYRCHHNTGASYRSSKVKNPHEKHTNCPANLMLTVKNSNIKKYFLNICCDSRNSFRIDFRSKDVDLKILPMEIYIVHLHNHPLKCADALRHRRPTEDIKKKFVEMFKNGHSPSTALQNHKFDLQQDYGEKFFEVAADGSICPNVQWCYHLYYSIFKKEYGAADGDELSESLNKFIDKYNETCGSICAVSKNTSTGPIVVVCSPLMQRIHTNIQQCGETMFVDSSGTMDRHNTRVFLFLTPSIAGALPLGIILTYSESEEMLKEAFTMWRSILPVNCFYDQNSPKLILTDDCKSERNALQAIFPESTLLLCKFHVLQAFWRYLWDSSHGVLKQERPVIFNMFKRIVNASDKANMESIFDSVLKDPLLTKNVKVKTHLEHMKLRVSEWTLSFRNDSITRGHDTNNYAEVTFRVLKDIILNRTKAYSIVQLFDFLVTRFESYFERRIIDVTNNRTYNYQRSRYHIADLKIKSLMCTKTSDNTFDVVNMENKNTYNVDMALGICSCPIGLQGGPCKHQYAVSKQFKISTLLFFPVHDGKSKENLLRLVNPDFKCSKEWFLNLKDSQEYVENEPSVNLPSISSSVHLPSSSNVTDFNSQDTFLQNNDVMIEKDKDSFKEEITLCKENFEKFCSDTIQQLQSKPDVYLPACKAFLKHFQSLKTESARISSFYTIGKENKKKNNTINVQPTAIARRKTYVGGRKVQQTGRPAKRSFPEHNYATVKHTSWAEIPNKIRKKAPHSLKFLIEENIPPVKH